MIPYDDIRLLIASGLAKHTGNPVINLNSGGDMPQGPFLTYDFPSLLEGDRGFPVVTQVGDKQISTETVHFTVSFLSYAPFVSDSVKNAMLARDWFKGNGRLPLKNMNVVLVELGAVTNRDVKIGNESERRQGFDVELRTLDIVEFDLEWIDKINI
ncbi:phage neck terminator protein [Paenibacillus macquariensis]|uniref:Phage neck terminator protein gp12-like domain-containing protein n=1 Tax=Paenibacillus macquariensis TaxID=948756 RepID=A0ABY1JSA6_9BACL|nr:hypothetical protein [Paenibacillus macquariensis]MEC0092883.1 hypothetical protein [Paenibacillus macquariensis]OAB36256.1 hypothetical protein PMSM_07355 [Paenibacillus macquariensis subsp. macquariensis]SIQ68090.1 hypothetical protein SAMN05421578_103337 [Paenibacillus macquariensis]